MKLNPVEALSSGKKQISPRVLLADDSGLNVLVAQAFLEGFGIDTDVVRDGHAALEKAQTENYALILLDIQMPGLDGLEVARRIRAHEEKEGLERVPILAVSAFARPEDRDRFQKAGIDDHLAKPFQPSQLREKVQAFLD